MKTLNIRRFLFPLALCALFTVSHVYAPDTTTGDSGTTTSTETDANGTTNPNAAADSSTENTLPMTLEQFDKMRALIQRQSDNALQLDKDFQAFLDDLLGMSTTEETTNKTK